MVGGQPFDGSGGFLGYGIEIGNLSTRWKGIAVASRPVLEMYQNHEHST
jgi:hypothetical protein